MKAALLQQLRVENVDGTYVGFPDQPSIFRKGGSRPMSVIAACLTESGPAAVHPDQDMRLSHKRRYMRRQKVSNFATRLPRED